jgi:hypothetical protein
MGRLTVSRTYEQLILPIMMMMMMMVIIINNNNTEDPLMQIVRTHQHNTSSTLCHTATNLHKSLHSDTKQIKTTIARNLKERWESTRLHGQFPRSLDEGLINKEQSYRWH